MIKNRLQLNGRSLIISGEWQLILFFAALKLLIHFSTFANFELHRDAYLYYAQSRHLAWGFFAVPPSIALVGKFATGIFGNTTFGLRFFPALIGSLNIIIIGLAVKELGGKKTAIALASLAYILSPAYLHVNALFQPVSFNHFYWLLAGYLILIMIKRNNPKIWIWIAITFGLAFLNKYSIVFFYTAFAFSLLISRYRYLYRSKYFLISLALGFVIILPNLVWQYQNSWPVLRHMAELSATQLVHVHIGDFLSEQLLMNSQALVLWMGALLLILFYKKEGQYRIFGYIYIFVIVLLIFGSGKPYYSLGLYPLLFVFGAYFTEKYIKKYLTYVFAFMVISMFTALYFSLSFDGIPLSSFEKAERTNAFRWEDGVYHDIPQDMADMTGWKEIGQKVAGIYLNLEPTEKAATDIFCYNYGQAGAVMFYGKKADVPQPIVFNASFILWAPDSLSKNHMIWVHSPKGNEINPDSLLPQIFNKVELKAIIANKYFRENGTRIYLCETPTEAYKKYYKTHIKELKDSYR